MSYPFTQIKGTTEIGDVGFEQNLGLNLVDFLNWGLLNIGGFSNITLSTSGAYGNNGSVMRPVHDPNFTDNTIFEGFKENWVWEAKASGVSFDYPVHPINISGIYLNNTFLPLATTGPYAYKINYPLGRIIFNSPIPASSTVQAEYSYRNVSIQTSDSPWFKQLEFNSLRLDDPSMKLAASGSRNTLGQTRVQMPAIIVEVVGRNSARPANVGGGHFVKEDVLFHIFGEYSSDTRTLKDIICNQKDSTIYLYDRNLVARSGVFPLGWDGVFNNNAFTYPEMVNPQPDGFRYKRLVFDRVIAQDQTATPFLMTATIRATLEIDFPEF
jgi:hypothetical protein